MVEKGTLKPQRFLTAIASENPDHLEGVSRELWKRIWSRVNTINVVQLKFSEKHPTCLSCSFHLNREKTLLKMKACILQQRQQA